MGIPDLVRRHEHDEEPEPSDLMNAPGKVCECGEDGCCNPIYQPRRLP